MEREERVREEREKDDRVMSWKRGKRENNWEDRQKREWCTFLPANQISISHLIIYQTKGQCLLLCKWESLLMPGWIKFSNQDWLWIHFLTIHQNFCFSLFCLLSFKADHCCQSCGSYSASWEFGCLNRNAKLRPAAMPGWKHKSPSEQVVIFWTCVVIGCSVQN